MKISTEAYIPFPRRQVYTTFRDQVLELVPYMSNVRSIEVKSRREEDGSIFSINEWHGGGDIPVAIRAIVNEVMLTWTEYDTWKEADFTLEWHIQTHVFTEAVHCEGRNRFIEEGNGTRVESLGELTIDPKQIDGFPLFLRGAVARNVEEFLGSKIEPNLFEMSKGVSQYLNRKRDDLEP